jgi:hypothetical protein
VKRTAEIVDQPNQSSALWTPLSILNQDPTESVGYWRIVRQSNSTNEYGIDLFIETHIVDHIRCDVYRETQ